MTHAQIVILAVLIGVCTISVHLHLVWIEERLDELKRLKK
jgi:hypothetical protein